MQKTYAFATICACLCSIFATKLTERRPLRLLNAMRENCADAGQNATRDSTGLGIYFSCDVGWHKIGLQPGTCKSF